MNVYTIWIDGQAYGGESEVVEQAPPLSGGWYDKGPDTVNGIQVGGTIPAPLEGVRCLRSHVERVINRIGRPGFDPKEIIIRVVGEI